MKVLVGYATAHGSTREIAERLGARLARHGLEIQIADLGQVTAPAAFDAFVLGSAVHGQRWLPEARAFVADHAPELAAKPVWLFSVGMPDALRSPLPALAHLLQPPALVAELADRISIRDHLVVSGVIRAEHLPLVGRLAMLVLTRGGGDYRDWGRIDAWTDGIARVLTTMPAVPPAGGGPTRSYDGPAGQGPPGRRRPAGATGRGTARGGSSSTRARREGRPRGRPGGGYEGDQRAPEP